MSCRGYSESRRSKGCGQGCQGGFTNMQIAQEIFSNNVYIFIRHLFSSL